MVKPSDKAMKVPSDVWESAERLHAAPGPALTVILRSAPRRSVNVVLRAALARGMAELERDAQAQGAGG